MITKEELKGLADLARMDITDAEVDKLTKDVDSILGYVGQIKDAVDSLPKEAALPKLRNVIREDVVTNSPGQYAEKILNSAPSREGQYIKVKKIL